MSTQLHEMFCNQCEQAAHGTGCEKVGVCGKSPDVSALQDLLVHALRQLAAVAVAVPADTDLNAEGGFVEDALFATLTNVDFDPTTIAEKIDVAVELRDALVARTGVSVSTFVVPADLSAKITLAAELGRPWDTTRAVSYTHLRAHET